MVVKIYCDNCKEEIETDNPLFESIDLGDNVSYPLTLCDGCTKKLSKLINQCLKRN